MASDGGKAFPELKALNSGHVDTPRYVAEVIGGMTLRDYFAAKAMAAILPAADNVEKRRGNDGVQAKAADYASIAYELADAMLAHRQK